MALPTTLHQIFSGAPLSAADLNDNLATLEQSFLDVAPSIISGLVPSAGIGLSVNVTAGIALLGVHQIIASFVIGSLTNTTTNYLFLLQNGTGTANTTGTPPANSVLLGQAVTAGGVVTSVDITRASGRQQIVQGRDLVHGGPAAGNPRSVNLAAWNGTAGNGFEVYGTLPAGAGGNPGQAAWTPPPAAATLSALNVTTATLIDSSAGGLYLAAPNLSATHLEGWYQSLGAGAYTWTVRLETMLLATTFTSAGLFLRDSVSGKIITFEAFVFGGGNVGIEVTQWSDANTRVLNAYISGGICQFFPWLRIADDGTTNRTYWVSRNGLDWAQVWSESRTIYLLVAPNQAGVFGCANGGPVGLNVYSYAGI